jgi:hypothetical protein
MFHGNFEQLTAIAIVNATADLRTQIEAETEVTAPKDGTPAGCSGVTCRIHWLSFTTCMPLDHLLGVLAVLLWHRPAHDGPKLFIVGKGLHHYDVTLHGPHAVRVYHSPGRADKHVEIPGTPCEHAEPDDLLTFFALPSFKCKRLDLALDGVKGPEGQDLDPIWIKRLCRDIYEGKEKSIRTWANLTLPKSWGYNENGDGETVYLGSNASSRQVRIYNKRGFTRIELVITDAKAEAIGDNFENMTEDNLAEAVVGHIRDFLDFVEPTDGNVSRAKLQPWWAAVVEHVDKIKIALPKKEQDAAKAMAWFKHQVSATFFTLCRAVVSDDDDILGSMNRAIALVDPGDRKALRLVRKLLGVGAGKIGPRHDRILATAGGNGAWDPEADEHTEKTPAEPKQSFTDYLRTLTPHRPGERQNQANDTAPF